MSGTTLPIPQSSTGLFFQPLQPFAEKVSSQTAQIEDPDQKAQFLFLNIMNLRPIYQLCCEIENGQASQSDFDRVVSQVLMKSGEANDSFLRSYQGCDAQFQKQQATLDALDQKIKTSSLVGSTLLLSTVGLDLYQKVDAEFIAKLIEESEANLKKLEKEAAKAQKRLNISEQVLNKKLYTVNSKGQNVYKISRYMNSVKVDAYAGMIQNTKKVIECLYKQFAQLPSKSVIAGAKKVLPKTGYGILIGVILERALAADTKKTETLDSDPKKGDSQ
jgi:hypothetical protein